MKIRFNDNTVDRGRIGQATSIFSKLFTSIFLLLFGSAGLFFFVFFLRDILNGKAAWPAHLFLIIPLIFMLIGFGGLYGVWFGKEKDASKSPASARGSNTMGKTGIILFGLVFMAAGLGFSYMLLFRPLIKWHQAKKWTETPCSIISAEVKHHSSDDGTTYSIHITYEYEFGGSVYRNDKYNFVGGSSSGYKGKKDVVERYKAMSEPVCYVNPNNPSEAVLIRHLTAHNAIGLFPLIFVGAGLFIMIAGIRKKERTGTSWLPQTKVDERRMPTSDFAFAGQTFEPAADRITLRPDASSLGKLFGVLIFCLIWNGVVPAFVYQVVEGFRSGRPEWFLTFFMIPFVLVGLGAIFAVFNQILALFNPRYTLTLQPGAIYPGTAGVIDWNANGSAHRIRMLTIKLLGKEEARYRVGTNTKTDSHTFFEMELVHTDDPYEIAAGQIGFAIPEPTMHSFTADNNKIIWSINIHGDIARWPDVKKDYTLVIHPTPIG
ncbi:MAG: DUF3592 domain-containing protein [Phycisphaerae bacterium]|nr:DUF3592 domain-containing protein [Phycisphaerae bacterium]